MFCNSCGAQINDGQTFCPNCGAAQTPADNNSVTNNATPTSTGGFSFSVAGFNFGLYDIIMAVACIFMIVGVLLPFFSVKFIGQSDSVSYIDSKLDVAGGWFTLVSGIICAVLYVLRKEKFNVYIAEFCFVVACTDMATFLKGMGSAGSMGIGFFMTALGIIVAGLLPFTPFVKERKFYLNK